MVAAFLRLGGKYDFRGLHSEAVQRLSYDYPKTLEDFDSSGGGRRVKWYFNIATDSIALARECDLTSILPVAFYRASHDFQTCEILAPLHTLSSDDRIALLVGCHRLIRKRPKVVSKWLDLGLDFRCDCLTCTAIKYCIIEERESSPLCCDALERWPEEWDKLCGACASVIREEHDEGRRKVWNELPQIFGLPPWGELV
jgi:hypothetical protein